MSRFPAIFHPVILASIKDTCFNQLVYWRWHNYDFYHSISSTFSLFFSLLAYVLLKEVAPPSFLNITTDFFFYSVLLCPFDIFPLIYQYLLAVWHRLSQYHNLLPLPQTWSQHVCKKPWFLWVGNGIRSKELSVRWLITTGVSSLLGLFIDRARKKIVNSWFFISNKKQPKI